MLIELTNINENFVFKPLKIEIMSDLILTGAAPQASMKHMSFGMAGWRAGLSIHHSYRIGDVCLIIP